MESLWHPTRSLLSQFTAQIQVRCLGCIASPKYGTSRPSVLGKRRRDTRPSHRDSRRNARAVGVRRTDYSKESAREGTASENRAGDLGFMIERRKMAAEFAEMRREEKQLFPTPGSQLNNPKPKSSHSTRSSQTSSKTHSITSPKEPISSTSKSKSFSKSPKQPFKSSAMNSLHIPILLEHPDFICINKPPSLLSQPGLPGEGTILTLLEYQRPDLTLQTVNRLDKNTSGVMVLGRTAKAIKSLNLFFKQSRIEKNYLALVRPLPGSPLYAPRINSCRLLKIKETEDGMTGTLTRKTIHEVGKLTIFQPKSHSPSSFFLSEAAVSPSNPTNPESSSFPPTSGLIQTYSVEDNSASLTHFTILARLEPSSKLLLQFTPLTGRKHQLRLHSSFMLGSPIIGDHRYQYPQDDGTQFSMRKRDGVYKDGYALHCFRIGMEGWFDVCAPLPGGRWGDVWRDVRSRVEGMEFEERVREGQRMAGREFLSEDIKEFLRDPEGWAKGIRGPLERVLMS